jgi:uncharacterized DUF497 family protein
MGPEQGGANDRKHGVQFSEAAGVFSDIRIISARTAGRPECDQYEAQR